MAKRGHFDSPPSLNGFPSVQAVVIQRTPQVASATNSRVNILEHSGAVFIEIVDGELDQFGRLTAKRVNFVCACERVDPLPSYHLRA